MSTLTKQLCLAAAVVLLVDLSSIERAAACSCLQPTVEQSYNGSTDVATVDVLRSLTVRGTRLYFARVKKTYKGCLKPGSTIVLTTSASSASCGIQLSLRTSYLINGRSTNDVLGLPALSVALCGYNVQESALTPEDRTFLDGRTVCCGDSCACADGTQPVQCFVDPCQVAPACDEGKCVANYCGGCNAEFYDDFGYAVCQEQDAGCVSDADCSSDQWCRQIQQSDPTGTPQYECVPFVGAGERCNGFTPPWLYERCAPGLNCDVPTFIADAPGICRPACESDADCKEDQYCAGDKTCDTDGACEGDVDCNLPGNSYPHIECVGYGICSEDKCGWKCGDPQCLDLAGYDLGPCDAVLGWGVLFGQCVQISGCSAGDFKLFDSQEACQKSCVPAPSCQDLSGVDFGPCKRLLGAGFVAGKCAEIGGCDTQGYTLFSDIAACEAACNPECTSDADCKTTGCSGQVCAAQDVVTTCEFRPEYACYKDPALTSCGCNAGKCGWDETEALLKCLDSAGPATLQ